MSAADRFLNDRPFLGHIVTLIISLIVVGATFAIGKNDRFNEDEKLEIESKASIEYVDSKFTEHLSKDKIIFDNIKTSILEIKQNNKDARAEYLIQIQLLRKDILDLYKSK